MMFRRFCSEALSRGISSKAIETVYRAMQAFPGSTLESYRFCEKEDLSELDEIEEHRLDIDEIDYLWEKYIEEGNNPYLSAKTR